MIHIYRITQGLLFHSSITYAKLITPACELTGVWQGIWGGADTKISHSSFSILLFGGTEAGRGQNDNNRKIRDSTVPWCSLEGPMFSNYGTIYCCETWWFDLFLFKQTSIKIVSAFFLVQNVLNSAWAGGEQLKEWGVSGTSNIDTSHTVP